MLTKEQMMQGNKEYYYKLTLEMVEDSLRKIFSEEYLKPYRDLGNSLYEIPGCTITNKKGLEEYLRGLKERVF